MILENVAIDFRCRGCQTVTRIEADLGKTIIDQLPRGWALEGIGASCSRCATGEPTAKVKADEKREEVRKLRMPTAEISGLGSPVTDALSPLVSDNCVRCNQPIGETQSWRPDPTSKEFAKVHRECFT